MYIIVVLHLPGRDFCSFTSSDVITQAMGRDEIFQAENPARGMRPLMVIPGA
jgi:hypothetical protein